MTRHHVIFHLKREESLPPSLGTDDNVVTACSLSRPAPFCSSVTKSRRPYCYNLLEEQLADARKRIRELKRENRRLQDKKEELVTYLYNSSATIVRLQQKLRSKETRQRTFVDTKKPNVELRVPEWRLELEQRWEEAMSDWFSKNEERVQKAGAEDRARRNRRVDLSYGFTGPLNMTRRKQELEDIAIALFLSSKGKKRDILERIKQEFEAKPELKSDPRFEVLFNSRPRKRARINEVPVAGPS